MLSLKLLGNVEISQSGELVHGFRSQKEPALLIYLAQKGQAQQRELVAELLWEGRSTEQALSNIRTALARLKKQVGDALEVTPKTLAVAPELRQRVDSVRLLQSLAYAGPITSLEQAVALQHVLDSYRGDFLADFRLRNAPRFDEWAATTREHIRRDVLATYHKLGQFALSAGHLEWGIVLARRWLQIDPLDESAHTLLIQLLLAVGSPHEATAHYDMCVALLQAELGIAPPEALTALVKGPRATPQLRPRPSGAARHNLPASYDQFFGRVAARQAILDRLDQPWCRLVTIVGPGGVGKTRLATTIARSRLSRYPDGVWLVELANLDPQDDNLAEAIAVEIASALDLRFAGPAAPTEQLLGHLCRKQMLLVLDNFEHLLVGVPIVRELVQRCEQVQLLVTSREPLQLQAEWMIALAGLSYPASVLDEAPAEAVDLFLARRAQQQWGPITPDGLAAIRTICRMVEGLPLAIELAAVLTRDATPQAVAERLRHSFDALTTTLRDMPQRHHSMQIVFEMSWHTLTPALQQRLACLSVFRGGCSIIAARQIADADARHLAALAEKSLLARNEALDRYTMHPVIRAYAAGKLTAADHVEQQHARYYLGVLAQHTEALQRSRPHLPAALLEPDIDNLRLAWQTGLGQRRADWLLAALTALSTYYQLRGLAQEGEEVMAATVACAITWAAQGSALATRAGLEQARFQNRLGRYWQTTLTITTALKLADQTADRWAEGMAHVLWGEALWRLGEYDAARNKLSHARAVAQAIGATLIAGWCHHHLGIIDDLQGRYEPAHDQLHQACAAWKLLEHTSALSVSLNSIGLVCYHQGDLPAAKQALEEALALCTLLDNRHMQALALNNLSMVATEQGDYGGAQQYLQRGLELAIAGGNLTGQGEIYGNLGRNYRLMGEAALAVANLEQGLGIAEALGNRALMAVTMLSLAEAWREQGDLHTAGALYSRALHIAQQDQLLHTACEILIGMAELLSNTNRWQAKQHSAEAVSLAKTLGIPHLLERANTAAYTLHRPPDTNQQHIW